MIKKFNEDWNSFEDYLKNPPKDDFDTKNFEVVGLPSGQIIYMNTSQVKYFKNRDFIKLIKIWKKPLPGGFVPIKIDRYCFEDTNYKTIMELIESITW